MSFVGNAKVGRAPKHLWVVGIVAVLWDVMGAFDYLMTQTKNESYMAQFTPEQLEFFYGFPIWVEATWAVAVWCGVFGSILLLMRRAMALPVFIASLAGMVLTMIHNFGLSNGMEVMGDGAGLAFTGVIFVVAVLLVVYARAMKARGVLG